MEKLHTSGITFVAVVNNETNAVSNLGCDYEMGIHGITCHVGEFINNGGVHGLIIMVDRKNVGFNCHGREDGKHFCTARNR